jgi:phospholipid/cholesterol/gamma-HCH transport system substrate-binding protein
MRQNLVETLLGAVVLVVAVGFLTWAYTRSDAGDPGGYSLVATFDRADGLDVGSDVRISGIKIGSVLSTALDPKSYRAEVRFSVRNGIELSEDSSASIVSASLLGGKYLSIIPGGADEILGEGQQIAFTQSSINIEDLIGQYIFSSGGSSGGGGGGSAGSGSPGGAPGGSGGAGQPASPGTPVAPQ